MDSPTPSSQRIPFKELSNSISTSVVNLKGQPTDARERNNQRARERYAQMDHQKKDELLKKRHEAYKKRKHPKRRS